jgi:uncharacterized protein (DUF2236 family)
MGLSWSDRDERRLRAVGFLVRNTFGRLPWWLRLAPQVRAAYRREAGRASQGGPGACAPP